MAGLEGVGSTVIASLQLHVIVPRFLIKAMQLSEMKGKSGLSTPTVDKSVEVAATELRKRLNLSAFDALAKKVPTPKLLVLSIS
ncbi:hypothetical protein [Lysobacter fragariae]